MRSRWLGFAVAALVVAFSVWAYPRLPAMVPTHWNLHGKVNGYSSRFVAAVVLPLLLVGLRLLLGWLPRIDPLGRNYDSFGDTYWTLVNVTVLLIGAIQVIALLGALGYPLPPARLLPLAAGGLIMFVGNIIGRVRPNWFVGIRTPWTLSSESVWRRTHRMGSWVFVAGGLVVGLTALLPTPPRIAVPLTIFGVVAVVPVLYSYFIWKAEQRASHS